jgi:hypothetical protein
MRLAEHLGREVPIVLEPIRFKRNRVLSGRELPRLLGLARAKLRPPGAILIVLDADDDCPARLGTELLEAARRECPDLPLAVVVAKRMFETWILAGAEGLVHREEISPTDVPAQPEETVKNPKRWISERIRRADGYAETADLRRLTGCFALDGARQRCPSFDKLCRELSRLLESS